jgi:hypothetical protein
MKIQLRKFKSSLLLLFFLASFLPRTVAQSNGFEVLNLAPTFQRYGDQNNVFLHGFDNTAMGIGHWNKAGHQLGGKMIANYVCTWLSR